MESVKQRSYANAKPRNSIVRVGDTYECFNRVRRRYTSDEREMELLVQKVNKEIARQYQERIDRKKREICRLLKGVRVCDLKDSCVTDIILIIKEMEGQPPDVVAYAVRKKLNHERSTEKS